MSEGKTGAPAANYFDQIWTRATSEGLPPATAVERAAMAYLEGKPAAKGKLDRDRLFWSSEALGSCSSESWSSQTTMLALARYLGQETVAIEGLLARVATEAPESLIRAVRWSGLVLSPTSPRRTELEAAAHLDPGVAELCRVLDLFDLAHCQRQAALRQHLTPLKDWTPFELLTIASLFAFAAWVPPALSASCVSESVQQEGQRAWDAVGKLLTWKLSTCEAASTTLNDAVVGKVLAGTLRPLIFEAGGPAIQAVVHRLEQFLDAVMAQIELDEFIGRSADAFSFDDSVRFERQGDSLVLVETDPSGAVEWQRDGERLARLHAYWFHRAVDQFTEELAREPERWHLGDPENADENRLAWIKALQAQLCLREVYGVADSVSVRPGQAVDVFRALLSANLIGAYCRRDFLETFMVQLQRTGDWRLALRQLALEGLRDGMRIRLPISWSDRAAKIDHLTAWTVSVDEPNGSATKAEAVLDFWSVDVGELADRLRQGEPVQAPHLMERPFLKFGSVLVQLPWVVGLQNHSAAAINNLRRLGSQRPEAREETQRIEATLASRFEQRGFRTLLNWHPPVGLASAGEVDLIASLGEHLFVIEVKSTFMRRSQREAWQHRTGTLRKAGLQVSRKVEAVMQAMRQDESLRDVLGITGVDRVPRCHGWIVDTSIEGDHLCYAGHLKVTVEEVLIALRDERRLLVDTGDFLGVQDVANEPDRHDLARFTLYPQGFSAERFLEVIESQAVWDRC